MFYISVNICFLRLPNVSITTKEADSRHRLIYFNKCKKELLYLIICKLDELGKIPHQVTCGDGQPSTVQESWTAIPSQTMWGRRGMEKSGAFMLKSSRNFRCVEIFLSAWGWRWIFDQSRGVSESQRDRRMEDRDRRLWEERTARNEQREMQPASIQDIILIFQMKCEQRQH